MNQGPVGVSQGPLAPGMSAEHAKPPGVMRLQGSSTHRLSAIVSVAWVASKSVRRDRRLGIARRWGSLRQNVSGTKFKSCCVSSLLPQEPRLSA